MESKDEESIREVEEAARESGEELALEWVQPDGNCLNFLEEAVKERSNSEVKLAVDLIGSRLTPFTSTAKAVGRFFRDLLTNNQEEIHDALLKDSLVVEASQFEASVGFFEARNRIDRSDHVRTVDSYYEWTDFNGKEILSTKWKLETGAMEGEVGATANRSTTAGRLMFLAVENAAKVGMNGMIRKLLMTRAPVELFKSNAVSWTVDHKWKLWRKWTLLAIAVYVMFLAVLTAYCTVLTATMPLSTASDSDRALLSTLLLLVWAFGIYMLSEEIKQVKTYVRDGLDLKERWTWGLRHYFGRRWNWVDLASCCMLIVVIPLFHAMSCLDSRIDDVLIVTLATEVVLSFAKVRLSSNSCQRK